MALSHICRAALRRTSLFLLMTIPMIGWGQTLPHQTPATNNAGVFSASSSSDNNDRDASEDLNSCRAYRVTTLPGSHQFASDFIEAIASDPDPGARDRDVIWGLTADLSSAVPFRDRAMYISKSSNGGLTWNQVARIDSRYFDAGIGEGLRNGFIVSPGAGYFVITTQRGAFQVFPQSSRSKTLVKPIVGPRVPYSPPKIPIPKKAGDPVRANVVGMTTDGKHLIVGYGYFDLEPQIIRYHKGKDGSWVEDGRLPGLPTEMDILSMQFADPKKEDPRLSLCGNWRSGLPSRPPCNEMESH